MDRMRVLGLHVIDVLLSEHDAHEAGCEAKTHIAGVPN